MRKPPFRAAIFDLDGTLLDSMYVWKRIDEEFFARRGMSVPEDYSRAIAGMSYIETADFTVRQYLPEEKPENLIKEWTQMARDEYALRVPLKPGASAYLRALRRDGVRLGIATALTPDLYTPCLAHLGIEDLFDCICSTDDTQGRGKASGEVFLLAAERLDVPPKDCAVFEDVCAGISGAKAVGMRAYCMRDEHSRKDFPAMERMADAMLFKWDDMQRIHDWTPSRRCVIFTAYFEGEIRAVYDAREDDYILCADAGWKLAERAGVAPDAVIGDFDTAPPPNHGNVEIHPILKDDTDTLLCVRRALREGFDDILVLGGMGGRLDHTLSNLQVMAFAAGHGVRVEMRDGNARVFMLSGSTLRVPRREGKLSLLAHTTVCRGVSVTGTLYTLDRAELTNAFPIGCSNAFVEEEAVISVEEGVLAVIQSKE